MTEICGIHIYSNLAPFQSENSKNTSTSEAPLKFTGAYKKSVYCVKCGSEKSPTSIASYDYPIASAILSGLHINNVRGDTSHFHI